MVRLHHAIRTGSFGYAFAVLALHGAERGFGALYWVLLALQFLAYPQLVYQRALRSSDPRQAEETNLFIDAGLLGAWIAGLEFPLWLAYCALFSTTMNATVVRGPRGGVVSAACFAGGAAAWAALYGFHFTPETSHAVTALAFAGAIGYSGWVGYVVYDLRSRLKRGRDALRASEAHLRLVAENAADLIGMVDEQGRWLYTSASYARLLDPADLAPGSDAFARAHPDDAQRARGALARAAATGKVRELPLRLLDRTGRVHALRMRVQAIREEGAAPGPHRLVLVAQDLTDLKEHEERVLLAAHALEGMTEAIMITSADGTVQTVNQAFSELTGIAREDAIGQGERETRNALQPPEYYDELYARARAEGYWSGTTWCRRANGSVYREWRSVRAVREPGGPITHFVHVFYEVSSSGGQAPAAAPRRA